MAQVLTPETRDTQVYYDTVFLAGSIEQGNADDWQSKVIKSLSNASVTFINPRRQDWDSSWKQHRNSWQFKLQVEWELYWLEQAKRRVFYFDPNTKSPVTLIEFGRYGNKPGTIVCCPEGFWRKGNIDIMCRQDKIVVYENLDQVIFALRFLYDIHSD